MTIASRFSHVFWIDASSDDTIALGLKGLCAHPEAKAAGISVSSRSALIWIASLQGKWPLVFDNADGPPEVVEKVIPSGCQGNILVTSRNRSLGHVEKAAGDRTSRYIDQHATYCKNIFIPRKI